MNKKITTKKSLDSHFTQLYVADTPSNVFITQDGELKTKSYYDVDGGVLIETTNNKTFTLRADKDFEFIANSGNNTEHFINIDCNSGIMNFRINSADLELFKFFGDGTLPLVSIGGEDGNYTQFRINEFGGGGDAESKFQIEVTERGYSVIETRDNSGAEGHMVFFPDGDFVIKAASGGTFFKEASGAADDRGAYGQIWVKNDTPNNLYFTDDTGNDVQITNNGKLAQKWNFNTGSRWYTRNDNWFFPSSTYGINSVNWSTTYSSNSLPAIWYDSYNPCIVVPENCTINSYHFYGNFTSSQTYEVALMTGTPSYGSAGNTSLSQIGATQSQVATGGVYYKLEQTGLSVDVSAGDIIIPCLRRTTTDTTSYYFFEFAMNIVGTLR